MIEKKETHLVYVKKTLQRIEKKIDAISDKETKKDLKADVVELRKMIDSLFKLSVQTLHLVSDCDDGVPRYIPPIDA